jgi:hypothetical protein
MKITKEQLRQLIKEEASEMDEIMSFSGHRGDADKAALCRLARTYNVAPDSPHYPPELEGVDCEKLLAASDPEGSREPAETRASRAPTAIGQPAMHESFKLSKKQLQQLIKEELGKNSRTRWWTTGRG